MDSPIDPDGLTRRINCHDRSRHYGRECAGMLCSTCRWLRIYCRCRSVEVNNAAVRLQVEPRVTLLDTLRERLGLFGTKKGCDHGQCGACTVHVDGRRVLSCLTFAKQAKGKRITTIEGIAGGDGACILSNRRFWIMMLCNAAIARRARSCRRSRAYVKAMPDRRPKFANI